MPKSLTKSRLILDCTALAPHLPAPPFSLPALSKVLGCNPLPPSAYMVKKDPSEAFYHFSLAPHGRRLTIFLLNGSYYRFIRLTYGIRPAALLMQALATAVTRYLCTGGLWAWSHIDNFLCAHPDPLFLHAVI